MSIMCHNAAIIFLAGDPFSTFWPAFAPPNATLSGIVWLAELLGGPMCQLFLEKFGQVGVNIATADGRPHCELDLTVHLSHKTPLLHLTCKSVVCQPAL